MSGIFGIVEPMGKLDLGAMADCMAATMSHYEWFVADRFVDPSRGVALGRIGIGIFNSRPQPLWNAAHTVALVMAGELYNRRDVSGATAAMSDEQLALMLYEEAGDAFVRQLNGTFVLGVWDAVRQRLFLATDRFGTYPLLFAIRGRRLLFAPEMKGILCDKTFPRRLDLTALAQYMRFQQLLGDRTFFEDLRWLPPASQITYDLSSGICQVKAYWTFDEVPFRPELSFNEAVEEAGCQLRGAVRRLSGDRLRPGVYLSGGLDSRTILGMVERRPIVSLTYGVRHCRDVYYAAQIARAVGSEHHWVNLENGNWIRDCVDAHLTLTEGFHSWIHAHGMSTLSLARSLMDVKLIGWDGGTVMGHADSVEPLQIRAVDDEALLTRLFHLFVQAYTWPSIAEAEEQLLYAAPLRSQMQGLAFDSFRAELAPYLRYRPDLRGEYFYIRNHCGRSTYNMVSFYRSHMEVRFPFFDYTFWDFLFSLPAELRGHRRLYRALIQRETPRLAYIPYDHDEYLPTTHKWIRGGHALGVRLWRRLRPYVLPNRPPRSTLYADYENYLRHELRDWAEGILYDRRTTERGIFDPQFVRTLMRRHLSGLEEWTIGKIAPLITYEMFLRRWGD